MIIMAKTIFLCIFSLFFCVLKVASTKPNLNFNEDPKRANISGESTINDLLYIGAVEGKSYFCDMLIVPTWLLAKEYCESVGLQQATVTTVAQFNFLANADFPQTGYWTGGREALELRSMSWDKTDAEPSSALFPEIFPPYLTFTYHHVCLALMKSPGSINLQIYECGFSRYPLCETVPIGARQI